MRESKYKAYNKKLNEIADVFTIYLNYEYVDLIDDMGSTNEWKFEDIELMEYTGLKDAEDSEISEGHILKAYEPDWSKSESVPYGMETEMQEVIYSVVYSHGVFGVVRHSKEETKHAGLLIDLIRIMETEVIGNIYQDKYLLE